MIPVIVPVFNRPEYTTLCLDSLYDKDPGVEIQPVIVNNYCRKSATLLIETWADKHSTYLPKNVARPIIVKTSRNRGFAGAVNEGIAVAGTGMKCILHNDTVVTEGWMKELVSAMDEETAVVCPTTNYANELGFCVKSLRDKFSTVKLPCKEIATPLQLNNIINSTYEEVGGLEAYAASIKEFSPQKTFCNDIGSFCMLVQAGIFDQYGGFDEDFWPRMFEDKFWFQNISFDGHSCQIANRSFVHHFGNITSDGPGFSFPQISLLNEQKYNKKVEKTITERGLKK